MLWPGNGLLSTVSCGDAPECLGPVSFARFAPIGHTVSAFRRESRGL